MDKTTIAERAVIVAVALGHLPLLPLVLLGVGLLVLLWLVQDADRAQRAGDLLALLFGRARDGGDPKP